MITDQRISKETLGEMSICPPSEVYKWATTLVIAPHPDDETLGCGGAIALLRQMGYRVHVVVLSDGYKTHPYAELFPRPEFRERRKIETEQALSVLGVSNDSVTFLDLNDSLIPGEQQPGFEEVVRLCRNKVSDLMPDTILAPWRRDAHTDHRAAWQITRRAVEEEKLDDINMVEYSIWALNSNSEHHLPTTTEVKPWRLDTKPVIEKKIQALSAYESMLSSQKKSKSFDKAYSSDMLAHFTHPWELYLNQHTRC